MKNKGITVRVDINIENPIEKNKNQGLPDFENRDFSSQLSFYQILEDSHIMRV